MKKLLTILFAALLTTGASAQFSKGTKYVSASLSDLSFSYSKDKDIEFTVRANGGYYFADRLMARATVGYEHEWHNDVLVLGAALRHNIASSGFYLEGGAEVELGSDRNDVRIPLEVGYTFYLNHYLAVEPAVCYRMSLGDFGDRSTIGLRLGLGFYF